MADQAPAGRGTFLGLRPRTALIVAGVAVAGGVVFFWWRSRQAAKAAPPASSTGCTDSSGNAVPCPDASGIDMSGQLSVIQTELESLLAGEGKEPAAAGGGEDGGKDGGGGSQVATVPNVVGDNWGAADNAIRRAGLMPKVRGAATLKGINTHRTVTAQSPHSGAHVKRGSAVTVTLTPAGKAKAPAGGGGGGGESESDTGSG